MHEIDLVPGAVLETGCVYLAEIQEKLSLPKDIHASANAKSTTGRLDVFTRLIGDHCPEFDRLPVGYAGGLYVEISPRTFSVRVKQGTRLNQIRLCRGDPSVGVEDLQALDHENPLTDSEANITSQGLGFSVDLQGENPGWQARRHSALVALDADHRYPAGDFWKPVQVKNNQLILEPDAFYILASRESVRIPPGFAAEMSPYLPSVGEFRVHYAGFFDPGFGWNLENNVGARSVLEVRCHEVPFALQHGQVVGRLAFEKMLETPEVLYSPSIGSSYQGQGLKLAKQFQEDIPA